MRLKIPREEIDWKFALSSGPGGQRGDKAATQAQGHWNPRKSQELFKKLTEEERERVLKNLAPELTKKGELFVKSEVHREREQNIQDVMMKLNNIVNKALKKEKKRIPTKPSKAAQKRRLKEKRLLSEKKQRRKPRIEF